MIRSYPCPWVFLLPQHHWSPWTALQLSGAGDDLLGQVVLSFFFVFNCFWWSIYYLVNLSLWKLAVKCITCMYTVYIAVFCSILWGNELTSIIWDMPGLKVKKWTCSIWTICIFTKFNCWRWMLETNTSFFQSINIHWFPWRRQEKCRTLVW